MSSILCWRIRCPQLTSLSPCRSYATSTDESWTLLPHLKPYLNPVYYRPTKSPLNESVVDIAYHPRGISASIMGQLKLRNGSSYLNETLQCSTHQPDSSQRSPFHPDSFNANSAFLDTMHEYMAISVPKDAETAAAATFQRVGFLTIRDKRSPSPMLTSVGDPEDLLGSVLLDGEGKMIPGSYERMPTYRLLTSTGGFLQLNDDLHSGFLKFLEMRQTRSI